MNELLLRAKNGATLDVPRQACQFEAANVRLAARGESDVEGRSFEMVATTGNPMAHWWWGSMVVDLAGIKFKEKLPALMDHDGRLRVGYTESISVEKGVGLVAKGKLMEHSAPAQEIKADAKAGFPWQASVYLQTRKVQVLRDKEVADVNGFRFNGPGAILRETKLREVTFTALGADDETSATPLAGNFADEKVSAVILKDEGPMKLFLDPAPGGTSGGGATPSVPLAAYHGNPELLQSARDQAAAEERSRCSQIYASCDDGNRDLANRLVAEGVPIADALLQLAQNFRTRLASITNAPRPLSGNVIPLAAGNTAKLQPKATPDNKLSANRQEAEHLAEEVAELPDEERWTAEFNGSAKLRAEFDSLRVYLAFKKNEHRCRDFGARAEIGGER